MKFFASAQIAAVLEEKEHLIAIRIYLAGV